MKKTLSVLLSTVALMIPTISTISASAATNVDSSQSRGGYVELGSPYSKSGLMTDYPEHENDEWKHGFQGIYVVSQYKNPYHTHSATARNGWGNGLRDTQSAGRTAYSSVRATDWGNKAFYNVY